ncbi:MAG: hypothetical protein AABX47_01490 [Nanoarchaeota archaeon]
MNTTPIALSKNFYVLTNDQTHQVFDKRDKKSHPLTELETKIIIYEDRVKHWFLQIAENLKNDNEAGFVILSIAIAYIEGNQQFRDGKSSAPQFKNGKRIAGKSEKFFIKGMRRIFDKEDVPKPILKSYYGQIRCGLFHDGMTKKNVVISCEFPNPISYTGSQDGQNGVIMINPHKFLDKLTEDFEGYISELKAGSDTEIIKNFETRWQLENA